MSALAGTLGPGLSHATRTSGGKTTGRLHRTPRRIDHPCPRQSSRPRLESNHGPGAGNSGAGRVQRRPSPAPGAVAEAGHQVLACRAVDDPVPHFAEAAGVRRPARAPPRAARRCRRRTCAPPAGTGGAGARVRSAPRPGRHLPSGDPSAPVRSGEDRAPRGEAGRSVAKGAPGPGRPDSSANGDGDRKVEGIRGAPDARVGSHPFRGRSRGRGGRDGGSCEHARFGDCGRSAGLPRQDRPPSPHTRRIDHPGS